MKNLFLIAGFVLAMAFSFAASPALPTIDPAQSGYAMDIPPPGTDQAIGQIIAIAGENQSHNESYQFAMFPEVSESPPGGGWGLANITTQNICISAMQHFDFRQIGTESIVNTSTEILDGNSFGGDHFSSVAHPLRC